MFLLPVLTIIYSVVAVSLYLKYEELKSKEEGIKIREKHLKERENLELDSNNYSGCSICKDYIAHAQHNISCLMEEITKFTHLLQDPKIAKKVKDALSKEDGSTHLLCLKENIMRIYKEGSGTDVSECHKAIKKFKKSTWKVFKDLLEDVKKI